MVDKLKEWKRGVSGVEALAMLKKANGHSDEAEEEEVEGKWNL